MVEKFTERARKVMSMSRQEAQRLCCEFIGGEHILLGIIQEAGGVAAKVLKNMGVDFKRLRQEIDTRITPSSEPSITLGQIPFSPRAKKIIELAGEAASQLGHNVVGTEHVLLGLLKESEGIAAQALLTFDLKLDEVRDMVLEVLGTNIDAKTPPIEIKLRPLPIRIHLYKQLVASPTGEYLTVKDVRYAKIDEVWLSGIPTEKQTAIAKLIAENLGFDVYTVEPF